MDEAMQKKLLTAAAEARLSARVPSSGFHVGAALLTKSGEIFTGCNVELENFLISICAERCALVKAISAGHTESSAIAVVTDSPDPQSPCGTCRQWLADFGLDWMVIMAGCGLDRVQTVTVRELLPFAFLGG